MTTDWHPKKHKLCLSTSSLHWDAMHSHDNDSGGIAQRRLLNQSPALDFPYTTLRVPDQENPRLKSCHRFLTALLNSTPQRNPCASWFKVNPWAICISSLLEDLWKDYFGWLFSENTIYHTNKHGDIESDSLWCGWRHPVGLFPNVCRV